jgi:hypothetical protein
VIEMPARCTAEKSKCWMFADLGVDNCPMGFLDNLESDLKSLEKQEERDPAAQKRRNAERASELAVAVWAERLKKSPYAQDVLAEAARLSHQIRSRIQVTWMDTGLKLALKERRLELRPTADGIVAVFLRDGKEEKTVLVDLNANGSASVNDWFNDPTSSC